MKFFSWACCIWCSPEEGQLSSRFMQ
jgi:hypothetical protein